jgi:hypothetical protein
MTREDRARRREEIRAMILERLRTGALPRTLPTFTQLSSAGGEPLAFVIGSGRGRPCAACDGADADIALRFAEDRDFAFHSDCEELWRRERLK